MSDSKETDDGYLLHKALSSLRTAGSFESDGWSHIRHFWEVLAKGGIDTLDAAYWAQEIAKRVVETVLSAEPQDRAQKALMALGMVGVERDHQNERDYVQMVEALRLLDEEEARSSSKTRRQFAQQMLDSGYFEGLSIKQAMNSIDYIKSSILRKK